MTTLYGILHRCPGCDGRLESPAAQAETETNCPACGLRLTVPADLLGIDRGLPVEEMILAFTCHHCDGRLLSGRRAVGRWAVCPHCERPLRVPAIGEALCGQERHFGPDGPTVHCSHCRLEIPKGVESCPYCEARDPFET